MPNRQAIYVQRERAKLIDLLGAKCKHCPETDPAKLEFDHIHGRDWNIRSKGSCVRINIYKREAAAGLLRLLCGDCNKKARKTNDAGRHVPTNSHVPLTDNIPF